ncbi:hypothetical protein EDEG_02259 [Edhazardia aedis USNM 41457]|uniref:Uncharacterized protein n=1 Tax=Edhazardia aedis (strain USNM 41457) TaxID=1003232 RepID=J9DPV6_EDHAE|nr:hypothetical protein EDEG_02259 [Edhazardia aedis USNM 41457]|eukprot:EJW03402.1 hypothetical protein EDEG_02259 [Edhazardia aedis USNM 41457]
MGIVNKLTCKIVEARTYVMILLLFFQIISMEDSSEEAYDSFLVNSKWYEYNNLTLDLCSLYKNLMEEIDYTFELILEVTKVYCKIGDIEDYNELVEHYKKNRENKILCESESCYSTNSFKDNISHYSWDTNKTNQSKANSRASEKSVSIMTVTSAEASNISEKSVNSTEHSYKSKVNTQKDAIETGSACCASKNELDGLNDKNICIGTKKKCVKFQSPKISPFSTIFTYHNTLDSIKTSVLNPNVSDIESLRTIHTKCFLNPDTIILNNIMQHSIQIQILDNIKTNLIVRKKYMPLINESIIKKVNFFFKKYCNNIKKKKAYETIQKLQKMLEKYSLYFQKIFDICNHDNISTDKVFNAKYEEYKKFYSKKYEQLAIILDENKLFLIFKHNIVNIIDDLLQYGYFKNTLNYADTIFSFYDQFHLKQINKYIFLNFMFENYEKFTDFISLLEKETTKRKTIYNDYFKVNSFSNLIENELRVLYYYNKSKKDEKFNNRDASFSTTRRTRYNIYDGMKKKIYLYSYIQLKSIFIKKLDRYNFAREINSFNEIFSSFIKFYDSQMPKSKTFETNIKNEFDYENEIIKLSWLDYFHGEDNTDSFKNCKNILIYVDKKIFILKKLVNNISEHLEKGSLTYESDGLPIFICRFDENLDIKLKDKFIKFYRNLIDILIKANEKFIKVSTFIVDDILKYCNENIVKEESIRTDQTIENTFFSKYLNFNSKSLKNFSQNIFYKKTICLINSDSNERANRIAPPDFYKKYHFIFDEYVRTMHLLSIQYKYCYYLILNEIYSIVNEFILQDRHFKINIDNNAKYCLYFMSNSLYKKFGYISDTFVDSLNYHVENNNESNIFFDNTSTKSENLNFTNSVSTSDSKNTNAEHKDNSYRSIDDSSDLSEICSINQNNDSSRPSISSKGENIVFPSSYSLKNTKTSISSDINPLKTSIAHRFNKLFTFLNKSSSTNENKLCLNAKSIRKLKKSITPLTINIKSSLIDIKILLNMSIKFNMMINIDFFANKIQEKIEKMYKILIVGKKEFLNCKKCNENKKYVSILNKYEKIFNDSITEMSTVKKIYSKMFFESENSSDTLIFIDFKNKIQTYKNFIENSKNIIQRTFEVDIISTVNLNETLIKDMESKCDQNFDEFSAADASVNDKLKNHNNVFCMKPDIFNKKHSIINTNLSIKSADSLYTSAIGKYDDVMMDKPVISDHSNTKNLNETSRNKNLIKSTDKSQVDDNEMILSNINEKITSEANIRSSDIIYNHTYKNKYDFFKQIRIYIQEYDLNEEECLFIKKVFLNITHEEIKYIIELKSLNYRIVKEILKIQNDNLKTFKRGRYIVSPVRDLRASDSWAFND